MRRLLWLALPTLIACGRHGFASQPPEICGWTHGRELTFSTPDLVDFPALVALDDTRIDYAHTSAGGRDLRFFDLAGNQLAHEIERWDPSGRSFVWVKVTTADPVWMFYGSQAAGDAQQPAEVWSNGYLAVWHFDQDPTQPLIDSTMSHSNGTALGAMSSANQVAGTVGGALDFDGIDDAVWIGKDTRFDALGPVTFSALINARTTGASTNALIFHKGGYDATPASDRITLRLLGTWRLHFGVRHEGLQLERRTDIDQIVASTWHHIAATWTGSAVALEANLYVDGAVPIVDQSVDGVGPRLSDVGSHLVLGRKYDATSGAFDGMLDELRIANVARDAAWIAAEAATVQDKLVTFGPEQPVDCLPR